jgi:hypothetical protein
MTAGGDGWRGGVLDWWEEPNYPRRFFTHPAIQQSGNFKSLHGHFPAGDFDLSVFSTTRMEIFLLSLDKSADL